MNADIQQLYTSPLFKIFDFQCRECAGSAPRREWSERHYISFTRRGNFGYRIGRRQYDVHSGVVLLENAGREYVVTHEHRISDACTTFCIDDDLLRDMANTCGFAGHPSPGRAVFPRPVMPATPATDYLHHCMYRAAKSPNGSATLAIDVLGINLLQQLFAQLGDAPPGARPVELSRKMKDLHLAAVDRGKGYMVQHFQEDISLADIARHAFVSPFHFSRLFKQFTRCSPYQYLLEVRLNHAVTLLRNTAMSVTAICFDSGFNSLDHFIATFKRRYRVSPLKFRHLSTRQVYKKQDS